MFGKLVDMKKSFGAIFWVHLALIVVALSSPFWLSWKFIFLGIVLLQLQWVILDGCYLTQLEAGKDEDVTFWYLYLVKVFPKLNKRRVKVTVRYFIPILLLVVAFLLQK
jgi:hypothetical protein